MAKLRGGLLVVVSAQLVACATARDATRGAGVGLAGLGALTVMVALAPDDCEEDWDDDEWLFGDDDACESESYTTEELEARGALLAGGTAAVLLGGGLVAVATPPKRKAPKPVAAKPLPTNARPPARGGDWVMRRLIERRCLPAPNALDLRVPQKAHEPRTSLPVCPEP